MSIFFQALPTQKPEEPKFRTAESPAPRIPCSQSTAPLKREHVSGGMKIDGLYSVLSEYGPIEAYFAGTLRADGGCIPCSQSTAPLKHFLARFSRPGLPVFRALRVRPH